MKKKTLLLVFVHGFKGDDTTFGTFPSHISALLSNALPNINVTTRVYPQFSTTGELSATVANFRDWLTNQVVDLEVELGTPSPAVDPGVRVIIVGHSMGGIVGAEAILGIAGEENIQGSGSGDREEDKKMEDEEDGVSDDREDKARFEAADKSRLMFPFVQGLLAFDTPFLGISPGVVAHNAQEQWSKGKAWYEGATGLFALGAAGKSVGDAKAESGAIASSDGQKALSSSTNESGSTSGEASTAQDTKKKSNWQRWGRTALFAGAGAAAAAAAGTTAYLKRNEITSLSTSSFGWVTSHLTFVGCLTRGEEMRQRMEAFSKLSETHEVGFANLFTLLGRNAAVKSEEQATEDGSVQRTFCVLPTEKSAVKNNFTEARNDKATNEVSAHTDMFIPKENPNYYDMGDKAKELVSSWVSKEWYDAAGEA